MASISENPIATPSNVKHLTVGDQSQRKMALGDIKNAPAAFDKSPIKNIVNSDRMQQRKAGPSAFGKSPAKMGAATATPDEYVESASASSKYVDHSDIWCNNLALSDAEITRWVEMMNAAWSMPMTPPKRPPTPQSSFKEMEILEPEFEGFEIPPPLPDFDDDEEDGEEEPEQHGLPSSDSSMYYSFDGTFELEL